MEDFNIEKNLKRPGKITNGTKYPWPQMEVGDSVEAPAERRSVLASSSYGWGKLRGRAFSLRKMEDGSYRIWRVL